MITSPNLVEQTLEKIKITRGRLKVVQDRNRSWADSKRRPLAFQREEKVYLKVSPTKGVMRLGRGGKLNLRYVGPYEILDRVGPLAYRLALPPALLGIHNVFHVSQLRKYVSDSSHILEDKPIKVRENLSGEKVPLKIVDHKHQVLRRRTIPYVKVQWTNHTPREAM